MSLKALVKAETNVPPSDFTLDLAALVAAASVYDHAGPFLAAFLWEVAFADTTTTADAFDMKLRWRSPSNEIRELPSQSLALNDIANMQALGPIYIIRKGPGELFELVGSVGVAGNSLINWQLALFPVTSYNPSGGDVIAI